jgi:hypothetical protein
MYALSVALAVNGMNAELQPIGQSTFIAQLPIEDTLGSAHAFHYTQVRRMQGRQLLRFGPGFEWWQMWPIMLHPLLSRLLPLSQLFPPPWPCLGLQCTIIKTVAGDKDVWAYDKRFHTSLEESLTVPSIEPPPEYQEGWKTIEGRGVAGWVVYRRQ